MYRVHDGGAYTFQCISSVIISISEVDNEGWPIVFKDALGGIEVSSYDSHMDACAFEIHYILGREYKVLFCVYFSYMVDCVYGGRAIGRLLKGGGGRF